MLNIQGLVGRRYNKLKSDELKNIFSNHDIVLFTETWSNELFDYDFDGFTCYKLHRTLKHKNANRDSGGLMAYISDTCNKQISLVKTVDDCIMWLKISDHVGSQTNDTDRSMYICLCYNVPANSSREGLLQNDLFDNILNDIVFFDSHTEHEYMILGDFNSRVGNLNDFVQGEFLHNLDLLPEYYIEDV